MYIPTEYLSPDDFEKFANKIVAKRFKKHIIDFGEGPDGGIDGMDNTEHPTIIVQSKRYQPSTAPSTFVKTVKNEIKKLEKTVKEKNYGTNFSYIIVTSVRLNPESRQTIRELKSAWIKDEDHIIDANELAAMSSDLEYEAIFKEYNLINGKLIDAVGQINLDQIELESRDFMSYFNSDYIVETSVMREAYECLRENRIVFLVGHPGVGKSVSSQYLGLLATKWKYMPAKVIRRSIKDTSEIIEKFQTAFADEEKSLVVIFDDFLGRNTLDAREEDFKNIRRIASVVRQVDNLFVIFNSRIEILKQGTSDHIEFGKLIENYRDNKITVNLSKLSDIDRARILRNNFEEVSHKIIGTEKYNLVINYNKIIENKYYRTIVKHKNYNPRLIEFIVREAQHFKKNFISDIEKMLNNPKKIYDEIYRKLSINEQYFLYSFASFREYPIALEKVKKLFEKIVPNPGTISDIYDTLMDSWIRIIHVDDEQKIDFLNPSLFDYLISRLKEDPISTDKIIENSPYLKNIQNLSFEDFTDIISNENWEKYLDYDHFIGNKLLSIITANGTCDEFESMIFRFRGEFLTKNKGEIVTYSWIDILNQLYKCDSDLKSVFADKLIFSPNNQMLFNLIVEDIDLNKLEELIEIIDFILLDVYNEGLDRSELIDSGEEETGFNLFSNLLSCLENKISEKLNDGFEMEYLIEQYFEEEENDPYDLVYDDDGVSWGDSNLSVLEEIVEDYLNSLVLVSDTFLEEIDIAFIIQNIEDNFYIELEDYIADITSSKDSSLEGESWFENNESNLDDIDEILNRPLSYE